MTSFDWLVLSAWLIFLVSYGVYRGRGSDSVNKYLLAGRSMPWYAMALSIMATQASAITFISTTGQSYVDGMRFVQFYFGLPLAMVILSATAVPIFHRSGVYTAYEYLEKRFDPKTRALVSIVFLVQRGLAAGIALYAPAVVLSVVLGWSDTWTTILMGTLVTTYTALGGIKAVTWADVQQMAVILVTLLIAFGVALWSMPAHVGFGEALTLAGVAGRLNVVDTHFDPNSRYNLWSGLIGGMFLALAYFGTDQSQVQRYLTGKSIAQSRLSLLFNAMAKVPMQFFILLIGAMVFVLFLFVPPPLIFHPVEMQRLQQNPQYSMLEQRYHDAFAERRAAADSVLEAHRLGTTEARQKSVDRFRAAQKDFDAARGVALRAVAQNTGQGSFNDTNYIFLSYVTHYLPHGLIGLAIAVIFTAAMSASSGEINSLATVTVIDVYKRYVNPQADDRRTLLISRFATVFWGTYAVAFASIAGKGFGALIEAVNAVGSLFYPVMLGVFVLAFFFKRVGANGAFFGAIAGQIVTIVVSRFTPAFLWYNVIGCIAVVIVGLLWPSDRNPVASPPRPPLAP